GPMNGAFGLVFGPDGNLYVSSINTNQILRYSGTTGNFIDVFATDPMLTSAYGLTFGPDGNLYVANGSGNNVLRFNGVTGASMGEFIQANSGDLGTAVGV